jgi:CHAT domain-containing protein
MQIPRLFASGREANEIMALAPSSISLKAVGFAANRDRVFSPELARFRIVHIATHGIINSERPDMSGILLSLFDQQGRSQNGFLGLHDIYTLKLPADLIVLSACSTALGKDVKGEGLVGLTRGFMYAGAAGVVASLWKVDDEATAELMKYFYAALLQKGLPPAAALRDAQLELAKQPRWQSPYYWAGFVIQGQYDQTDSFTPKGSGKTIPAVIAFAGASFLLASVLFLRRRRRVTVNA